MYRLMFDPPAEAVFDALPARVREPLILALADACEDPLGATEPYGVEDKVIRQVVVEEASAVLLLGHTSKTVTVLEIHYLP